MYKNVLSVIALCFLGGCTTWVKEEISHAVTSEAPDYGKVPDSLPRNANGFSRWTLPFIRDFESYGISAYFDISNTIRMAGGRIESKENEPLVVKVYMFVDGANSKILIKDFSGDLFLSSNKVLHPVGMYIYSKSFCMPQLENEKIFDLHKKEVTLIRGTTDDRVHHALEKFHVLDEEISAVSACMVFTYPESVPVKNVFKINFANIVLDNGEINQLSRLLRNAPSPSQS